MWPYWLMFLLPAAAAMKGSALAASHGRSRNWSPGWIAVVVVLAVAIGYRHEVGGDWGSYLRQFYEEGELVTDPGYRLLNTFVYDLGGDIYDVNLVCGLIFSFCLAWFCRDLPRPWLALAVAIPYLVIVVGMGYTRQAVALGFAMLGMSLLQRGATVWFVFWILIGATFHKTAVLLVPIAALTRSKNRYWTIVWVALIGALSYQVLLRDQAQELYAAYVEAEYQSEGALVRALMNALPGAILLLWRKRFQLGPQSALWTWMAAISIALPFVLVTSSASTAVDRMALYMLPLQLVVFSRLPDALGRGVALRRQQWVFCILAYYLAVQFTWLNFATHAEYWLPYQFYPLESLR